MREVGQFKCANPAAVAHEALILVDYVLHRKASPWDDGWRAWLSTRPHLKHDCPQCGGTGVIIEEIFPAERNSPSRSGSDQATK